MTVSCYIYYRVPEPHIAEASNAALRLIALMRDATGISSRIMKKVGDPLLWMEVYEGIDEADTFTLSMQNCLSQSGLEQFLEPDFTRHVEMFQCA